jgi:hypothetical protein
MNTTSPPTTSIAAAASISPSHVKAIANTLQPKKSTSSPLSKIKFHSISKRRFSGQKLLNLNEKFQLINKKHGTSSSSFIGSDVDYDYISYGATDKSSGSGGKSSSLKKYFLKFTGDKTGDSNGLEAKNLFQLKRHNHYHSQAGKASTSDENDFDVLNF